jgi:hypothetical protein
MSHACYILPPYHPLTSCRVQIVELLILRFSVSLCYALHLTLGPYILLTLLQFQIQIFIYYKYSRILVNPTGCMPVIAVMTRTEWWGLSLSMELETGVKWFRSLRSARSDRSLQSAARRQCAVLAYRHQDRLLSMYIQVSVPDRSIIGVTTYPAHQAGGLYF